MRKTQAYHFNTEVWSVARVGVFHWKKWPDSDAVILYFSGNGDTHLLTYLGYLILEELRKSPKTQPELIQVLTALIKNPDEVLPFPTEMVKAHLFHLKKIGLVVS
ncbi:MAG: hypothetical protein OQL20_03575 [Sedimenticola sp.]|nr:hypothetical protein [Sedimenticola sp.]